MCVCVCVNKNEIVSYINVTYINKNYIFIYIVHIEKIVYVDKNILYL